MYALDLGGSALISSGVGRLAASQSRNSDRKASTVDDRSRVVFSAPVDRHHASDYHAGAVSAHLDEQVEETSQSCDVGMATAAAMFRLHRGGARQITVSIPLGERSDTAMSSGWDAALAAQCRLETPNNQFQQLYDVALRTLILHAPNDIFAGPFTYKRFWFRDAALIAQSMLCVGLTDRAEHAIDRFPARQTGGGYFHSQQGEWDANGQVLWAMQRLCDLTGQAPKQAWRRPIMKGARWIMNKRLSEDTDTPHAGLLPPGFSAEHLGPNDYYYWDDFWGIGGLQAAASLCRQMGEGALGDDCQAGAKDFQAAVNRSLGKAAVRLGCQAMPASPYRRLDAGAVGSLAAGYPLRLLPADDARLLDTVRFLLDNCFVGGGLFHDIIHSGINPYLTLHTAQVLMRAGDPRCLDVMQGVADLASPTGQWPEAVHPRTRGGCMGDGQHVWAAAEWIMQVRNSFVREEGGSLVLGSGLSERWFEDGTLVRFGPAPTPFGPISIEARLDGGKIHVTWDGDWRTAEPVVEVRLPTAEVDLAQPPEARRQA